MTISEIVGIAGSGIYLPSKKVSVEDLAKNKKLDPKSVPDIKQVHIATSKEDELFMAKKAALEAIENAGVEKEEIDLVIYCSANTNPKSTRPGAHRLIQEAGLIDAYGFDIQGGFMGGLFAIQVGNNIIKNNPLVRTALIVGSQEFDELYFFGQGHSRIGQMIFGDGAAAIVLKADAKNNKIISSNFVIDHNTAYINDLFQDRYEKSDKSSFKNLLKKSAVVKKIGSDSAFLRIHERLLKNMAKALSFCLKSNNLDVSDVNHIIKSHLPSGTTEQLCNALKVTPDIIVSTNQNNGYLGHADILANIDSLLKNKNLEALDVIALLTANYDCSAGAIVIRR